MKRIIGFFFSLFLIVSGVLFIHPASAQTVTIPPSVTYSGILRNGNGVPISGMYINLSNTSYSNQGTTASDGSFSIQIPPGTYTLNMSRNVGDASVAPTSISVSADGLNISTDTVQDLTLPTKNLDVTVLDSFGQLLANATVTLITSTIAPFSFFPGGSNAYLNGGVSANITTGAYGVAHLAFLPSSSVLLTVTPPAGSNLSTKTMTISLLADMNITINLSGNVAYNGILRNGVGVAISGMYVALNNSSDSDNVRTGSDGSFSLHVPSGIYTLSISTAQPIGAIVPSVSLSVDGVNISTDTVQDLTVPTKTLNLTVLDSSNNPVANADISVQGHTVAPFSLFPGGPNAVLNGGMSTNATTDISGVAHITFLPSSSVFVYITPPIGSNLLTKTITVSLLADSSITVNLDIETITYSGILRNGVGVPISDVGVVLSNLTASDAVTTGSDGSFSLHVPTGTYDLTVNNFGKGDSSVTPKNMSIDTPNIVVHGDTVQDLTLPTKTLAITVLDPSGNPLPYTSVSVQEQQSNVLLFSLFNGASQVDLTTPITTNSTTDASGIAVLALLPSSTVTVTIAPPTVSGLPTLTMIISFLDNQSRTVKYNQSPVINPISEATISEGSAYLGSGSFSDSDSTSWTATVDYGDGSGSQPLTLNPDKTFSLSHLYKDNGIYTATVSITDNQGATSTGNATVTVNNVVPTVGAITAPTDPVQVTTTINASASFTDLGVLDTHTAVWDFGDGTTSGTVTESNGSGSISDNHIYTAAGVYTINLTVTDKDGGIGLSTFQYVVVYDPSAGYVTGAGTITSPTEAYTQDPTLSGKAIFGFVSKYQNGVNLPTGSTQFRFIVANFSFKSTSYDWLVVGGARAQYKGSGTVNGSGDYAFILTSIDGQISGGGGTDKFRLKVWDKITGNIIYDNQLGASDTSDPTTTIDSGSITIHK